MGVREARERVDIVGVPFAVDASFFFGTGFEVEDGLKHVGFLAGGDLAFAVPVPDWLAEGFGHVGVVGLEVIEDGVGADDVGFAAGEGAGDAEQADYVTVVGWTEVSYVRV